MSGFRGFVDRPSTQLINWEDFARNVPDAILWMRSVYRKKYYNTRKRPNESPLGYLHRLSVAGLRAKLQIKYEPK
ncbi:Hypothetical protein PHPALM_18215 [Phytophthora palmivora]|uniref:Uncharacterized protein n=1 Tax=Phytophthora palmivora TaxID=4796 RepID=A0A2P4XKA7_9STRA|nr:Hypothetical protein PHPALM_18215 [Phytophthora palmivora]